MQLKGELGPTLTPREREILTLAAAGRSNREIGVLLGTSPHTVRHQVTMACSRLGARGRTHAVILALRAGVIT